MSKETEPLSYGVEPPGEKLKTTYVSLDELKKMPEKDQKEMLTFWWLTQGVKSKEPGEIRKYYLEKIKEWNASDEKEPDDE